MVVLMPDAVVTAMRAAAAEQYPRECCGLLVGTAAAGEVRVRRHVPARNVAPADRLDRFEIDPQTLIDVHRGLRAAGEAETVVGHYHSHPGGQPVPSATDAAWITDPAQVWVILSVTAAGAGEVRAWRPVVGPSAAAGRFQALEMRLVTV